MTDKEIWKWLRDQKLQKQVLNIPVASGSYSIGQKWKIYYNPKNRNNCKFIIKAVIDSNVLVYLTNKGNYVLQDISFLDMIKEQGFLVRL